MHQLVHKPVAAANGEGRSKSTRLASKDDVAVPVTADQDGMNTKVVVAATTATTATTALASTTTTTPTTATVTGGNWTHYDVFSAVGLGHVYYFGDDGAHAAVAVPGGDLSQSTGASTANPISLELFDAQGHDFDPLATAWLAFPDFGDLLFPVGSKLVRFGHRK
ncbi:hypothetical protein H9P43_006224 [Blastocladiella emersonii ATCC 22665]|nr:hypothetical protein H9P43_006224 [Blastocladiella emersonii ATCC 22665]